MSTSTERHRVLGGRTRARLLAALRAAGRPMDVRELASSVGVHRNSAREQLRRLHAAGLVRIATAAPAGRGRPSLRYALARGAQEREPYRVLARVLADQVARLPDPVSASIEAGERWGGELAAQAGPGGEDAVGWLVATLDEAGFEPEEPAAGETVIRLRRCPFEPVAPGRLEVVCGVHLGFLRGALRGVGAPVDAVGLEPYVRPDLCLASLAPRVDG